MKVKTLIRLANAIEISIAFSVTGYDDGSRSKTVNLVHTSYLMLQIALVVLVNMHAVNPEEMHTNDTIDSDCSHHYLREFCAWRFSFSCYQKLIIEERG